MNKKTKTNGGCFLTCLKGLGFLCLISIFLAFGWIAGIIWLLFFRRKLNNDPVKQRKWTIIVSIFSVLSLIFFIYSMFYDNPSDEDTNILSTSVIVETMKDETKIDETKIDKSHQDVNAITEFVNLYNSTANTPIIDLEEINIHDKEAGYYRTEFRLLAFKDAIAMHGLVGETASLELIQYSQGFRIYILADSYETIQEILATTISIYDASVTDDMIKTDIYDKINLIKSGVSFYVNDITGYYEVLNKDDGSCSIMLDTSQICFTK